jgi:hypothetical protein
MSAPQKTYRIGIGLRPPQGSYNLSLDHAGDIQLLGTSAATIGKYDLFLGRVVDRNRANIKLAQSWLRLCESEHGQRCAIPAFNMQETSPDAFALELLVVDVEQMSLYKPAFEFRYVALSYCWLQDTDDHFFTTLFTLPDLFHPGSLKIRMRNLSPIIQDAIDFVKEFGERFLWIDALCIVQDDELQKPAQIRQMDLVYGAATLTIICAPSEVTNLASQGLPGYRSGSRFCPQFLEEIHGLTLTTTFANLDWILMKSRWDKRAWTFQEGIPSRRKLFSPKRSSTSSAHVQSSVRMLWERDVSRQLSSTVTHHFGTHAAYTLHSYRCRNLCPPGYSVALRQALSRPWILMSGYSANIQCEICHILKMLSSLSKEFCPYSGVQ